MSALSVNLFDRATSNMSSELGTKIVELVKQHTRNDHGSKEVPLLQPVHGADQLKFTYSSNGWSITGTRDGYAIFAVGGSQSGFAVNGKAAFEADCKGDTPAHSANRDNFVKALFQGIERHYALQSAMKQSERDSLFGKPLREGGLLTPEQDPFPPLREFFQGMHSTGFLRLSNNGTPKPYANSPEPTEKLNDLGFRGPTITLTLTPRHVNDDIFLPVKICVCETTAVYFPANETTPTNERRAVNSAINEWLDVVRGANI